MIEIQQLVCDFKKLSQEDFLTKYDAPVVLHQTDRAIDPKRDFVVQTRRATEKTTVVALNPDLEVEVAAHVSGVLAFEVRSQKGAQKVTVGRVKTNDIQLPYSKVSVKHAVFSPNADGEWTLTDIDSTNGTWLNGKKITPQQPQILASQDEIKLGTAEIVFYSPAGLYYYLSSLMAQIDSPT